MDREDGDAQVVCGDGSRVEGWMVLGGRSRSNEEDIFEMLTVLCDVISEINVMNVSKPWSSTRRL